MRDTAKTPSAGTTSAQTTRIGRPPANRRRAGLLALAAGLAFVLSAVLLAPAAGADVVLCGPGAGAGQCEEPRGVALDRSAALLFVADEGNHRIDVFDANSDAFIRAFGWGVDTGAAQLQSCTTASGCQAGIEGSGAGQLSGARSIAVDDDPASPAYHDLYVLDRTNHRVQRFHPNGELVLAFGTAGGGTGEFQEMAGIGVVPGGTIYVVDTEQLGICSAGPAYGNEITQRLQKFSPAGETLEEIALTDTPCSHVRGFAVDSASNFYVATDNSIGAVRKYDAAGNLLNTFNPSYNIVGLALGAADDVYLTDSRKSPFGSDRSVLRYDSSGTLLKVLYGDDARNLVSLAPLSNGDVFAAFSGSQSGGNADSGVVHIPLPAPGPLLAPGTSKADPVGNTKATLNAAINPEGTATTYHFEYVDDAEFGQNGFQNAKRAPENPAEDPTTGADFDLHLAQSVIGCPKPTQQLIEEGKCLASETKYHFRAVATNADVPPGEERIGPESTFTTKQPFEIGDTWASEVGVDSALIQAQVNPLGIPTGGHFEYVEEATYTKDIAAGGDGFKEATEAPEVSAGAAPLDFGSAEEPLIAAAQLDSLEPGTAYRFRVFVEDPFRSEFGQEEGAFRTFPRPAGQPPCPNDALRAGPSAPLPDCRAYEMVSPVDKEGGEIWTPFENGENRVFQSAATVPGEGRGIAYTAERAFGDAVAAPLTSQYIAARHPLGDPEEGWSSHGISPPREGGQIGGAIAAGLEIQYKAFSEDLTYSWLRNDSEPPLSADATPGFYNVYRRDNLSESYEALCPRRPPNWEPGVSEYEFSLTARSGDNGETAALSANDQLTPDAVAEGGPLQVYACREGELVLVSVGPGGEADPNAVVGNLKFGFDHLEDSSHNAVSGDGNRIYWSDLKGPSDGEGKIYLRERPFEPQSAFAHGAATGAGNLTAGSATVSVLIAAAGTGTLTAGSPTVTALETTTGKFIAGQPIIGAGIPAETTIEACSPSCERAASSLTLSKNATASGSAVTIKSKGPMPFAPEQTITGPGIPLGTTITAVALGSLTLSKNATETQTKAPLSATSPCTEPAKACTVAVSEAVGLAGDEKKAIYWTASPDGARAIFSFEGGDGGSLAGNLYEFDATATSEPTRLIAEGVSGLAGWSEDAERLYLVSTKALAAGAIAGKANLYLYDAAGGGSFRLVAPLPSGVHVSNICAIDTPHPGGRCTRATADGEQLAFMSNDPLTGYDSSDASSPTRCGEPKSRCDSEVFLYDALAKGGEGELLCVSCNPSGGRPGGQGIPPGATFRSWIAGRLPPGGSRAFYTSRALAADGRRLFFESFDRLVAADTNGALDVYQWERAGEGGCEATSPEYVESAGGCIALISSGQDGHDSRFVDASADGSDAFFVSSESLWPEDPGLLDLYDARVGGGFRAPEAPRPPCEGEACQSPPAPPEDPTPASAAFEGAGNVPAEAPAGGRCAKPKVRRHGRCVARHHKRAKRAAHRARHSGRAR